MSPYQCDYWLTGQCVTVSYSIINNMTKKNYLTKKERSQFTLSSDLNPNLFPFREECTGQKS
jgi:hypothetical protein